MKKITIKIGSTVAETFEDCILSRKAKGLSDKTLITYNQHFKAVLLLKQIGKYSAIVLQRRLNYTGTVPEKIGLQHKKKCVMIWKIKSAFCKGC